MAAEHYGWGATEIVGILKLCEKVLLLYMPGPHSAIDQYRLLYQDLQSFKSSFSRFTEQIAASRQARTGDEPYPLPIECHEVHKTVQLCKQFFKKARFDTSRIARAVAAIQHIVYDGELASELRGRLSRHSQALLQ